MSYKIEISGEKYAEIKRKVLENEVLTRIDVKMSDIEIESLEVIKISGREINLTKEAVKDLAQALGVSKIFIDTLNKGFGKNDNGVLNYIIKLVKGQKVKSLTFIFHKKLLQVTKIYPAGTKLIEDAQYFEVLEKILDKTPGSYLRNLLQSSNGNLSAVLANPKLEFQFGGMANEVFTSGMTLDLTEKSLMTSFFTERLVCTNGAQTKNKLVSREVNTSEKVPEFLTAILDAGYHLDNIEAFKKRIDKCYHTRASLREVLQVDGNVKFKLGNFYDTLTDNMSIHRFKAAFPKEYLDDRENHKFYRTDITLWELVNEITAISSRIEQHRIAVPEKTNLALQMAGGNLMFQEPDLVASNIKQIY